MRFYAKCPECGLEHELGASPFLARWNWFWQGLFGAWSLDCPGGLKTHMEFKVEKDESR